MMQQNSKIYLAGHNGLLGSATQKELINQGYGNILTKSSTELNLIDVTAVDNFFQQNQPEYVFFMATQVGNVFACKKYPSDIFNNNLQMELNIINACIKYNIKKLIFVSSSCAYPKHAPKPIAEDSLFTGKLEETAEPYGYVKLAGHKMCEYANRQYGLSYNIPMFVNLYGENDNYNPKNSRVLPALLHRFHNAKIHKEKTVDVWGSGQQRREFLNSADAAKACIFLMNHQTCNQYVNIGVKDDISILELAQLIKKIVGYNGDIVLDKTKPEASMIKKFNLDQMQDLGWHSTIELEEGIKQVYQKDFLDKGL